VSLFLDWYQPFVSLAMAGRGCRGIPEHHAMLFSYFDDSSDKRREHYFACGGLLGHENQWNTFDLRWLDATHELEKPFRSTECEGGHGQFHDKKKWPKPKREALMDSLVAIIRDYRLSGFASIVPIADYRAVFPESARFDPYYLAVRHTLINMAVIADQIKDGMKVWFEDSSETSLTSHSIYKKVASAPKWKPAIRFKGVAFESKKLCPLQSADLVAREAFKHLLNRATKEPTRKAVTTLSKRLIFIAWNRETLTHLKEHGGPENYELLTHWESKGSVPSMNVFYRNFYQISAAISHRSG
jgi:hypothetical protein